MRSTSRRALRAGFTLIEMLVALLLTSMVALLSHQLLAGVVDATVTLRRAAAPPDGVVLGREWLLEGCRTLEVGTPGAHGFEGTAQSARFDARTLGPTGWVERRPVTLDIGREGITFRSSAVRATVVDSVGGAALDYLVDGAGDGGWVNGWSSPVSAPLAIRIRWIRAGIADTLLCPIGARG
jgi:prepilin-type N-terminal cleavage/methylation domain-containing protein